MLPESLTSTMNASAPSILYTLRTSKTKCKPVQTAELQPPRACDLCEVCSQACHSNLGQCEYWWQGREEASLPCTVLFGNAQLQRISITQLSLILKVQSHLLLLVPLAGGDWKQMRAKSVPMYLPEGNMLCQHWKIFMNRLQAVAQR